MRPIDADALDKDLDLYDRDVCGHCGNEFAAGFEAVRELIADSPTIDAEPVRHEGNTTVITTNNLEDYTNRIIVGQGRLCKVYYVDEDVRHGTGG